MLSLITDHWLVSFSVRLCKIYTLDFNVLGGDQNEPKPNRLLGWTQIKMLDHVAYGINVEVVPPQCNSKFELPNFTIQHVTTYDGASTTQHRPVKHHNASLANRFFSAPLPGAISIPHFLIEVNLCPPFYSTPHQCDALSNSCSLHQHACSPDTAIPWLMP